MLKVQENQTKIPKRIQRKELSKRNKIIQDRTWRSLKPSRICTSLSSLYSLPKIFASLTYFL